jgi:putative transposase
VATQSRRPILTLDEVRLSLREGIDEVRQSMPFNIEAWVLLPDHLHTIWTLPEKDANYGSRWAIIKRHVTRRCDHLFRTQDTESKKKRREGGIWQRRFWEHTIRNENDFQRHMDYIHWNPVKHGYVQRLLDWPYSTLHKLVAAGVYPANWGGVDLEDPETKDFGWELHGEAEK